jgi:hypothetical protein
MHIQEVTECFIRPRMFTFALVHFDCSTVML